MGLLPLLGSLKAALTQFLVFVIMDFAWVRVFAMRCHMHWMANKQRYGPQHCLLLSAAINLNRLHHILINSWIQAQSKRETEREKTFSVRLMSSLHVHDNKILLLTACQIAFPSLTTSFSLPLSRSLSLCLLLD